MTIIVTGAAGFIGCAVSQRLLDRGETVVGIDNFNTYYDPRLKAARAAALEQHGRFHMVRADIADAQAIEDLVRQTGAKRMVHLAAQAGVRAEGFAHLVYASSSSVYGDRPGSGTAFAENDDAADPVSLYAATKRAGELMGSAYAALYGIPQTGLRFFTVYGPWGRPDMAYFAFTDKILAGETIEVFGEGTMARDFTYIDDIVDGVIGVLDRPPPAGKNRILKIGDNRPVGLMTMIAVLEKALGHEAKKVFLPMQPGDVTTTFADISRLQALTGYRPKVALEEGLPRFVAWHRGFYGGES